MSITASPLLTGDVYSADCPSREVFGHVTSKWGVLVLAALAERGLRWGELRRRIGGISEKMLAQTLRTLEQDGFVQREAHPVIPPRVDYALTPLGAELAERLLPVVEWIADNVGAVLAARDARRSDEG
ncbi:MULTISPECIES: helix-turn-helix domain-containing protein [Rathayibacter]|uniref:winged helix-turn-helix transcriptional regulator n=1 Tax=Rathayibacter TaxID=33886 RepID=UPI00156308ED|nr:MULTISPECIES: helix-turn-helix domain-containing protein [Rathayibacter]MDY0915065.1 helix-turn-helix domain-containing protein [Rathayibacter festucae]NQX17033.1 helix-turn-helix transcriptional regulator [Rathayibacter sp. VKM Ac-2857]